MLEEKDILNEIKLETLQKDIQKGLESGESTPLNIEDIKAKARKRRTN